MTPSSPARSNSPDPCPDLRQERLRLLGELTSGLVHDLNNVLAPIIVGVQLLRQKPDEQLAQRLLETIENSARRGAVSVRQLLLFARGETPGAQSANLPILIDETVALLRQAFPKNITLAAAVAPDVLPVYFDPAQLQQVLLNLCVNARDAMPHGGRIVIRAENSLASTPSERTVRVILAVEDTGTGMTPEVQAKVFEPFFSTKPAWKGTGLGLPTVRRQVLAHDGEIELKSTPGVGTAVRLSLRVGSDLATCPRGAAELPEGNGDIVLVVDDEESNRDMLANLLHRHGFKTITAANGAAGIAEHRSHGQAIRLTLTDLDMPVLDGARMLAELRLPADAAVIVTGQHEHESGRFPVPAGYRIVHKPFTIGELLAAVHACRLAALEKSRASPTPDRKGAPAESCPCSSA